MFRKKDLVEKLVSDLGGSKKAMDSVVDQVFFHIALELGKGNDVLIPHVGRFRVVERDARVARNPRNGEPVQVPAKKVVRFRPANFVRDCLSEQE